MYGNCSLYIYIYMCTYTYIETEGSSGICDVNCGKHSSHGKDLAFHVRLKGWLKGWLSGSSRLRITSAEEPFCLAWYGCDRKRLLWSLGAKLFIGLCLPVH